MSFPQIFKGNSDNETIVQQNFTKYIYARYFLINPQSFVGAPRLRIELLGVDDLPTTTFPTTNPPDTTTTLATTPLIETTSPVSTPLDTTTTMTSTTESTESFGLYQPFGVQDNTIIPDGDMTASSQLDGSEAYRGRLNGDGAWQPSAQGTEFLAVDLLKNVYVVAIQTQGQGDGCVDSYRVIYQRENTTDLIVYSEDGGSAKIFTGNSDNETIVQQNFTSYIYARYILINPQSFVGAPRLRMELLGVDGKKKLPKIRKKVPPTHDDLPCNESTWHNNNPGNNSTHPDNLPGIDSTRHNNLPGIDPPRHNNLPGIDPPRHNNLPGIDSPRHNNLPGIDPPRHNNLPGIDSPRHNNPSGINTPRHNNSEKYYGKYDVIWIVPAHWDTG
ncbi:EGF-like repeat and discoidin I-like domain-containing protein 3 [Branchiostoma lanceolatum]|uniref:EGF-like repeat and discoidin I-like domain-containing protein 3 n=1 Tax=Branchiostoma lanceolatum TaxID=7740 RepID=UPI0034535754